MPIWPQPTWRVSVGGHVHDPASALGRADRPRFSTGCAALLPLVAVVDLVALAVIGAAYSKAVVLTPLLITAKIPAAISSGVSTTALL